MIDNLLGEADLQCVVELYERGRRGSKVASSFEENTKFTHWNILTVNVSGKSMLNKCVIPGRRNKHMWWSYWIWESSTLVAISYVLGSTWLHVYLESKTVPHKIRKGKFLWHFTDQTIIFENKTLIHTGYLPSVCWNTISEMDKLNFPNQSSRLLFPWVWKTRGFRFQGQGIRLTSGDKRFWTNQGSQIFFWFSLFD